MTQRTKTQLGNDFIEADPKDYNDNLLDSIFVLDTAAQHDNTLTVGATGTGHDVQFYGDVDSGYLTWDASEGALEVVGTAGHFVEAPSDGDGSFDVGGTMTTASALPDMSGYFKVKVNGTLFKVPFFQDA